MTVNIVSAPFTPAVTGGVQRLIGARLIDAPSIRDFGALGNGSTNDRPALVLALAAADHIRVPAGTYVISTSITVAAGKVLVLHAGASLAPATAQTVTIDGALIHHGVYNTGAGAVTAGAGAIVNAASASSGGVTDPELLAIASLTSAADRLPYFTGSGTASLATFTAAGRALVDDADAAAQRTTLGLVIGTNVQAQDAELAAIAGLTSAADNVPYFTGSGTAALASLTTTGRALIDDTSVGAQRTTLGVDVLSLGGHIETVAVKTYYLDLKASRAYTINSLAYRVMTSGSCTIKVQIDAVDVTGLTSLSATGTEVETSASAANSVATGNTVTLVVTANTAALDLAFTLKVTLA